MKRLFISLLLSAGLPAAAVRAQEPVYPDNSSVTSLYHLSDSVLSAADTLIVTRTLTNAESFPLTGLYFSDNLPAGLNVVGYTATLNGAPLAVAFAGPLAGNVIGDFRTYRWVVDSPEPTDYISRTIYPGDQVRLTYRIAASDIGDFVLPLHTTVCFGNGDGIFATGQGSLRVTIESDDDDPDNLLPATYLVTSAYPNPFNAEVAISYEGANVAANPIDFEVFNLLGQELARYRVVAEGDAGIIMWSPDAATGTGVFLYRLSCAGRTSTGKLMLLK